MCTTDAVFNWQTITTGATAGYYVSPTDKFLIVESRSVPFRAPSSTVSSSSPWVW